MLLFHYSLPEKDVKQVFSFLNSRKLPEYGTLDLFRKFYKRYKIELRKLYIDKVGAFQR